MKRIFIFVGVWVVSSVFVFAAIFYMTMKLDQKPDASSIITQLHELSRYETASFTVEKIVDVGERTTPVQDFFFGDRLILVAHGRAIAGFDLSKITERDVLIKNDTITVVLPKPELLLVTLDNEKTQVYDRDTGVFTRPGLDLEREARLVAEDDIVQAACAADLLKTASDNAHSQLKVLLQSIGFSEVVIQIPEATCIH